MDLASKGAFFAQKLKFIRKSAFFYVYEYVGKHLLEKRCL